MKLVLIICLLPSICSGQRSLAGRPTAYVSIPNAGYYSSAQTALTEWIRANGGNASRINYGGDLFSLSLNPESNFIAGIGIGGLYSGLSHSSLSIGYGDLHLGAHLFRNELFQANILAHLSILGYTVNGIVPPNSSPPATNSYYLRGQTLGGGPSLRVQIKIRQFKIWSINAGAECGVTFINPLASWRFGYDYINQNGKTIFCGRRISGPEVDRQISYVRCSITFGF